MKRRILEVLLDQVHVPHGGRTVPGESRHLVSVTLVWPRMAIAHKSAMRAVVFHDGYYRPPGASWTGRALFKETVEGPFGIRVEVSEALSAAQWAEAVARLGSAVWTLVGSYMLDAVEGPVAGMLWKAPFDALARTATALAKSEPRPVAAGVMDLQCEDWPTLREQRLAIPLTAPRDLTRVTRRRVAGKIQSRQTVLRRADESNGETVLLARVYG